MAGKRFRRLIPAPVTAVVLAVAYLALQGDWSVASAVTGVLLGLVLPLCASSVISDPLMPRSLSGSLVLVGIVLWDILLANVDVARRVLGPEHVLRPAFIRVPLDVQAPEAIALLASIITLTPGTLSADLTPDQRHLLVHALHAPDTAAVVATIKSRYEARLKRLFEDS
jgi:multicomponent K+:H+ antiporter subunit E